MLAVRFESGQVVVDEVPRPSGEGVRVKVRACGICGSDVTMLDEGFSIAGTPGHEIAGELPDGTPVAIEPLVPCGHCVFCRQGNYQVCHSGTDMIYGVGRDGGMAEEILVSPRCIVSLPRTLDAATGFLVEPLAVALHGFRRVGFDSRTRVLVVGGGTIGLCAVAVATSGGAEVSLIARHPAQVEAGKRLGAEIARSGAGGDYDLVVDCAGTRSATAEACESMRPHGRLLMLASSWGDLVLPGLTVAAKEIDMVISSMYGVSGTLRDVDAAAQLLGARGEIADALISHRFPLDEAAAAFETSRDRKAGAIKVVLEP